MSHPHPHAYGPPGEPIGHVPPPPVDPLEEPSQTNKRLWFVAAALAVIAILAMVLTWQSVRSKGAARSAEQAAVKACEQVQGLGQKCATAAVDESPGADAVVPGATISSSLRPVVTASANPDESAAQPGMPGGPLVNPGSDLIVGLTLRDHRLEITYSDGTVVDAGRIEGAPPAIVLPVGPSEPSPTLSLPMGTEPLPEPPATTENVAPDEPDPTDTGPLPVPTEEMTYIP